MERIQFDELLIENFGPYCEKQKIKFSKTSRNITLIKGLQIGTGKTTITHLIRFILFRDVFQEDYLLKFVQRKKIKIDSTFKVGGKLKFDSYDSSLNCIGNFTLSRYFTYHNGEITHQEFWINKDGEKLSTQDAALWESRFRRNILHRGIRPFLLIQGEKLDDLIDPSDDLQTTKVRDFALELSDLPTINRFMDLLTEFDRLIQKKLSKEQKGQQELNTLNKEMIRKMEELDKLRSEIVKLDEYNKELAEKIEHSNSEIEKHASKAKEGEKLNQMRILRDKVVAQVKRIAKNISKLIQDDGPLLYLEEPMRRCLADIKEKEGKLWPKNIDRKTALALQENKDQCEVCGRTWEEESEAFLNQLISSMPEGFNNTILINFRSTIEKELDELTEIKIKLASLEKEFISNNSELITLNNEYASLTRTLEKKYTEEEWLRDFRLIVKARDRWLKELEKKKQEITEMSKEINGFTKPNGEEIKGLIKEINNLRTQKRGIETRLEKGYYWTPISYRVEIIKKISEKLSTSFTEKLISTIELNADKIFKNLIWNPEHFSSSSFKITEKTKGWEISLDGATSTGQTHILALSYIFGLSNAISCKIPLFIDSPFVVVDKATKQNLARKLPKIMMESQIILFVKDTELEGIEDILKEKCDFIYTLQKVDKDETRIVEV